MALVAGCAWLCVLGTLMPVASANAQIAFTPCGNSNNFACGHLTVPLDPSGTVSGTITLAIRRHRAPVGEAHTAIIALAGGPGQAALPFAEAFAELLGPTTVAVIGGVKETRAVAQWMADRDPQRPHVLRFALQIAVMLTGRQDAEFTRAWFHAANPRLDDRIPMLLLRDLPLDDIQRPILMAARAFASRNEEASG